MIFTGTTAELRDAILAGTDVTSPASYPGKITLTQLNAFSGTLEPEALTNFKTLKVNSDGSVEETNVAKLLIDLQSGSGVEDAKEEALIDVRRLEGDNSIQREMRIINYTIGMFNYSPVSYTPILSPDYSYLFARDGRIVLPSDEAADGIIVRFKPAKFIISSKTPLVFLNGVLQGEGDIASVGTLGSYVEFVTAPEEGSLVEFYFDDSVNGDSELKAISNELAVNAKGHADFQARTAKALKTANDAIAIAQSNKMVENENQAAKEVELKEAHKAVDSAKKAMAEAQSVSDVITAKAEIEKALADVSNKESEIAAINDSISKLEADIASIDTYLKEQNEINSNEANKFAVVDTELQERKALIESVKPAPAA